MTMQREGIVRLGADAASATDVANGTVTVLLRRKRQEVQDEGSWGNANPTTELGGFDNEVEIVAHNQVGTDLINSLLWAAAASDTGELYVGVALSDDDIGSSNVLYETTAKISGAEIGGTAGQHNTQRWVYKCGAITDTDTDPQV